jgi:hypothetical protein
MNRKASAVAAVASIAALAFVGCGGSDSSSSSSDKAKSSGSVAPRAVVGGSATYIPAAATLAELEKAGVTIGVGSGAKKKGSSIVLVFRDGKMVRSGLIGKAESRASIVFARDNRQVKFEDVIVDTARRRVTGIQGENRIILFLLRIKGLQQTTLKDGSISATGLSVKLSPGAAKRLNEGLAVKVFEPGARFGTVALTVRLKKSTGSSSSN